MVYLFKVPFIYTSIRKLAEKWALPLVSLIFHFVPPLTVVFSLFNLHYHIQEHTGFSIFTGALTGVLTGGRTDMREGVHIL